MAAIDDYLTIMLTGENRLKEAIDTEHTCIYVLYNIHARKYKWCLCVFAFGLQVYLHHAIKLIAKRSYAFLDSVVSHVKHSGQPILLRVYFWTQYLQFLQLSESVSIQL